MNEPQSGTHLQIFLRSRQTRLALTYLAIIVGMTLLFSGILYYTSSVHFERFAPPRHTEQFIPRDDFLQQSELFRERRSEAKLALIDDLILLNLATLVSGAYFSYYLAGRTLRPIERSMHAQTQFISDASHELRTPLATLQTSNEVILKTSKHLEPELKELLESNVAQTEKLRNLTDGLLGLIKAEQGQPSATTFNLGELINSVARTLEPLAAKKHVTLSTSVSNIDVHTDETALTRVLQILLDNAIKYSEPGKEVAVHTQVHTDTVEVAVQDHGEGIAPEDLPKIFMRFYRADPSRSTQHSEGYGIGLAIAKTLCDQQSIPLLVKSILGKGSTFSLLLPRIKEGKKL